MESDRPRVLVVDDEASFADLVADVLGARYDALHAATADDALRWVGTGRMAVVVVDLVMPDIGGLELAARIRAMSPDTQVVILTGHGSLASAIEGIHHGVFDYLEKAGLKLPDLERAVERAVDHWRLLSERRALHARLDEQNQLLTALHDISTSLAAEPHVDRIARQLLQSARSLCPARRGRLMLMERTASDERVITFAAGDGAEMVKGARLAADEGISTLAAERGIVLAVDDPRNDARYSTRGDELPDHPPLLVAAPVCHAGVTGALILGVEQGPVEPHRLEMLGRLCRQAAVALENALQHERATNFFTHACDVLVSALDAVDTLGPGHSRATATHADMISRRLGLSEEDRRNVHFGALLHDIGKVRLEHRVLHPEHVDEDWRRSMQQHCELGLEMLRPITVWEGVLPVVHCHHERWDGQGYPLGLRGEEIPLGARIVAVAEAFDAMTRGMGRHPKRTPDKALAEMENCAGSQFDPRVVRIFATEYRSREPQT